MSMNLLTRQERIHHRSGHVTVRYGKYILVWGGYIPVYLSVIPLEFRTNELELRVGPEYHYMDEVWAYDSETEIWHQWCTTGDPPPMLSGCVGAVIGRSLYVFGGYCHIADGRSGNTDRLYQLDLLTLHWRSLEPAGQPPTACDKLVAWTHGNKMFVFGGFGPTPVFRGAFAFQVDPSTLHSEEPRGWNNQLVVFDPHSLSWDWPRASGAPPSPRAAHAADVTGDTVYIFGGRFLNRRTNDLYSLNLKTMQWSPNLTANPTGQVPRGRSWHSFTFVSPTRAILYGGLDNRDVILRCCWELDVERMEWTRVNRRKNDRRHWHTCCLMPKSHEVFLIGGTREKVDDMLRLEFAPKTLLRLCLDAALSSVPRSSWQNGCLPRSLETTLELRYETGLTHTPDSASVC